MMKVFLIFVVIMNIAAFILMRIDKQRYRQHGKRISQRVLFLPAIFFGAIGGTIAMFVYHHKRNHWEFRSFFPSLMIIQIVIIAFALMRFGL